MLEVSKPLLGAFLLLAHGCAYDPTCDEYIDRIFAYPHSEWKERIRPLSMTSKFNAYTCGLKRVHPPPYGMSSIIIENDPNIRELAWEKIIARTDPYEQIAAINILLELAKNDKLDCKNDAWLSSARENSEYILDEELKNLYEDFIGELDAACVVSNSGDY